MIHFNTHTNEKDPPQYDILDETGALAVEHIVKDTRDHSKNGDHSDGNFNLVRKT